MFLRIFRSCVSDTRINAKPVKVGAGSTLYIHVKFKLELILVSELAENLCAATSRKVDVCDDETRLYILEVSLTLTRDVIVKKNFRIHFSDRITP